MLCSGCFQGHDHCSVAVVKVITIPADAHLFTQNVPKKSNRSEFSRAMSLWRLDAAKTVLQDDPWEAGSARVARLRCEDLRPVVAPTAPKLTKSKSLNLSPSHLNGAAVGEGKTTSLKLIRLSRSFKHAAPKPWEAVDPSAHPARPPAVPSR